MKRAVRKFYTLVEIMTVIVIAAILFGIGIPAFTTMIQGSNMTIAIRQLSAKISAARAYAVTNRCKVAVLLVRKNVKEEYCLSAYRACILEDSSSNIFQEWIEDENWKHLPKGVLVLSDSTDYPEGKKPDFKDVSVNAEIIGGSASTTVSAFIFQKNGQMDNATSTIWLRQGRYVNSNPVYTERNNDGKIISHQLEIQKYSGKVKVKDISEEDS